jgi:hypothetical protein
MWGTGRECPWQVSGTTFVVSGIVARLLAALLWLVEGREESQPKSRSREGKSGRDTRVWPLVKIWHYSTVGHAHYQCCCVSSGATTVAAAGDRKEYAKVEKESSEVVTS